MDYENQRIGFAKSSNWGKPGSRNFINWALSGSQLMNLMTYITVPTINLQSEILLFTSIMAITFFISYYYIVKKNRVKKVKAVVLDDDEPHNILS